MHQKIGFAEDSLNPPHARRRPWFTYLFLGLLLLGLTALAVWNVTRSESLVEARKAYAKGDLVAAVAHALDHRARQPWSREASLIAALSLSRLDRADEAEPYYRRAGELSLNDLHVRAFGIVRGNLRERAVSAYHEILERWPDNVLALRRLGAVEMTRANDYEVARIADRLIAIPEGAAIGYTLRGVVHHNEKNHEDAVLAFERVLAIDPDLREMPLPKRLFWSHLVVELMAVGRPSDARKYLQRALQESPDAYLMHTMGVAYENEGAIDDAERCFRQAMEWDPKYVPPYVALAKLELHSQRQDDALARLQRAQNLAPGSYDVLYTLGLAYRQLGRIDEANRYQARALTLRPKPLTGEVPEPPRGPLPRYAL